MGKPKPVQKKKSFTAKLHNPPDSGTSSIPKNTSIDQLISKAAEFENEFELTDALKCYNQALKQIENSAEPDQQPLYHRVLQSSAYTLLELGRPAKAKERLLKLLQSTPDPDYEVLMYLGQLTEGEESLSFYRKGLAALQKLYGDESALNKVLENSNKSMESLQRAESNAHCAIAELFMTDLCDLPEARAECQKAFEGATQTDPSNPQAWLVAANFHTVTADSEASKDAVQRCLAIWWTKLEEFLAENQKDELGDDASDAGKETKLDIEELTGVPVSGLIALCRMMIELEMDEKCATILEALLEQEEDNLEVYYLLTVVGRKLWKEADPDLLRLYATTAKVIAGKLGDSEMADEMTELLEELPECTETGSTSSIEPSSSDDEDADMPERQ